MSRVLKIAALAANLGEVQEFIGQMLKEAGCREDIYLNVELAVEEVFVNIASYAYPGREGTVEIEAQITDEPAGIRIVFSDDGIPFDPLKKEDPDITLSAEERQIGGLGIYLVKEMMDEVHYRYEDGRNVLTVIKYLE